VPQAVEIIGRNARLQSRLIEDILDVSRIITDKLVIDPMPLLPAQLVETAVAAVAPEACARGITLTRTVPADLPPIDGDLRRLEQVLGNLLSNAVKFTPEGGHVEVTCAADAVSVVVEVRDSGIGIAPELLPHIFDRFRQGDSRTTRRHGGLGLGLAVARHIVERHGGTIAASSSGDGRGTTMTVRLPLATIVPGRTGAPECGPRDAEVRLEGVRALVVDDQADARHLLRTLIEQRGGHVVDADGASTALSALASSNPNVLIADLAMPDVDGFGLIALVRATHPHLPGIALTAHARPEDRDRAIDAGYSVHFAKPFDIQALVASVRDLTGGARPRQGA
jgi:CheY-like chemotaxis protein